MLAKLLSKSSHFSPRLYPARRVFGPDKAAAQLEGSKAFLKVASVSLLLFCHMQYGGDMKLLISTAQALCKKHGIPTGKYEVFRDPAKAKAYVHREGAPIVVKADGLAAGKGVTVAATVEEACSAIDDALVNYRFGAAGALACRITDIGVCRSSTSVFNAGNSVVVEEFLEGEEVSFFALVDGEDCLALASAQACSSGAHP